MSKVMVWYLIAIGWLLRSWLTEVMDGDVAGSYVVLGAIAINAIFVWREAQRLREERR